MMHGQKNIKLMNV